MEVMYDDVKEAAMFAFARIQRDLERKAEEPEDAD